MAEWLNAAVLKTVEGVNPPGVRIPVSPQMFFTYILSSEAVNRHYYGHCKDLNIRLKRHNDGNVRSTKAYRPWRIHYFETYSSKSEAFRREMFFKSSEGKEWLKAAGIID